MEWFDSVVGGMGVLVCLGVAATISVDITTLGYSSFVSVYDIWAGKIVDTTNAVFSANVPLHGTGFYRLSATS